MTSTSHTTTIPVNGVRLRNRRKATPSPFRPGKTMSQNELSTVARVSRSYIAEIEKGKKQPRELVAYALAEALEVELDDLIS